MNAAQAQPSAHARAMAFADRHGGAALLLACHAAVLHLLRPEALALVRTNFLTGAARLDPALDAALLFSELCEDRGGGFFELDADVKHHLVRMLDTAAPRSDTGRYRSQDVARFVREYVRHVRQTELRADTPRFRRYLDALAWRALALDDADAAAKAIVAHLDRRQNHAPDSATPPPLGAGIAAVAGPVLGTLNRELVFARALDMIRDPATEDEAMRLMAVLGDSPLGFGDGPEIRPDTFLAEQRAFRRRRAHVRRQDTSADDSATGQGGTDGTPGFDPATVDLAETALHGLARSGDAEGLAAALGDTPGLIDTLGKDGLAPLHIAVQRGHGEAVARLIAHGASLDVRTPLGATPFFMACEHGRTDIGLGLIAAGADPFLATAGNATALMAALFYGSDPLAEAILAHPGMSRAHLHHADDKGRNALMWTAARGSTLWFDRLLAAGATLGRAEPGEFSFLHQAAWGGNAAIAARLIAAGHPVDLSDGTGWTPLNTCAQTGAHDVAALLLDCGADPDRPQGFGWPPLLISAHWNTWRVFSLLHAHGADMAATNSAGLPAVHVAAANDALDVIRLLLEMPEAEIACTTADGHSALDQALRANKTEALCLLAGSGRFADSAIAQVIDRAATDGKFAALERLLDILPALPAQKDGATSSAWLLLQSKKDEAEAALVALLRRMDTAPADRNGTPFLCDLATRDLPLVLDTLLERGDAPVDVTDTDGETPLRKAVAKGRERMARRLLTAGADPNHPGGRMSDPILASARGGLVRLLLEQGADPHRRGPSGRSALHALVAGRDLEPGAPHHAADLADAETLATAGLSHEQTDATGARALHLAAAAGNAGWMALLLDRGAAPDARDHAGATALHHAAATGKAEAAELLLNRGADGTACRDDGLNAAALAARGDHDAVLRLLIERGLDTDPAQTDRTLVQLAAELNSVKALEVLLDAGHDARQAVQGTPPPLILAVQTGSHGTAELLGRRDGVENLNDPRSGLSLSEIAKGRLRLYRADRSGTGKPRGKVPGLDVLERLARGLPPAATPAPGPPRKADPPRRALAPPPAESDIPHSGVFLAGVGQDEAAALGSGWKPADTVLRDLVMAQTDEDSAPTGAMRIVQRPLPFHPGLRLVRLCADNWKNRRQAKFFLQEGRQLLRLNGTSPVIHAINTRNRLVLSSRTVLAYLRFFCFFVRGEEGPFYVAESMTDPVLGGFTGQTAEILQGVVRPAAIEGRDAKGFLCSAVIFYSNALFTSQMRVQSGGMVEMLKDEPIAADLPTRIDAPIS